MNYWWRENKGYAIPVFAGAIAVALWYVLLLGGVRKDTEYFIQQRQIAELDLQRRMAAGVPSEDVVNRARRDLDRTRKLLDELQEQAVLRVPQNYTPPGNKTSGEYFVSLKEDVRRKIRDAAQRSGVGLPEKDILGFKDLREGADDEVGRDLLAALAVVEKLEMGAIQAGVTKIEQVNATANWVPGEGPARKKGAYLSRLSVRMKVTGPSKSVFEWLHGAQKKDGFLAIEDFKAAKESPHEDKFSAEMEASGLSVDAQGALIEEKKE